MITRRIAAVTTAVVVAAAGGAAAIAATVKDDRKAAESAIIADAAKRLDVAPSELKDALGKAQDAQLDQAVKDGKLTQEQADAIKKRRAAQGTVLGLGPHGGPGGPGHGGPGRGFGHRGGPGGPGGLFGVADDAAKALGLTRAKLFEQLRSGKTLAQIAKAQDKELSDVKATVKAAITERLAAAVKAGKVTAAQRDRVLEEFDEHFDAFASGKVRMGRGPGHRGPGGPGFGPGGPGDGPTGQSGPSGTQDGVYPGETSSPNGQPA